MKYAVEVHDLEKSKKQWRNLSPLNPIYNAVLPYADYFGGGLRKARR